MLRGWMKRTTAWLSSWCRIERLTRYREALSRLFSSSSKQQQRSARLGVETLEEIGHFSLDTTVEEGGKERHLAKKGACVPLGL
jgi:hypothetical protein